MVKREDCIKVGVVSKTHNLQGAVIITTENDLLEQYVDEPVFLLLEGAPVPFFIADSGLIERNHTSYIVKFDYIDSLISAERLVGSEVLLEKRVLEHDAVDVQEDDVFGLIDFEVLDENTKQSGVVVDVADYSGNVILTINLTGKEILLPLSETFVQKVDFEAKRIWVHIPTELIDLN